VAGKNPIFAEDIIDTIEEMFPVALPKDKRERAGLQIEAVY
jgi:hypothetical protein